MIRTITPIVEEMEPPLLLYTKECRLHLNAEILRQYHRRRLPILVSFIAQTRTVLQQEHRMARHILNRYHANFARPLVLSFL
jgi:hypothetical protein